MINVCSYRLAMLAGVATCALMSAASRTAFAADPASATAPSSDQSQVAQGTSVEEIVVTARKREEKLINVPVAVTALAPVAIARYSEQDLNSIGLQMPNVNITQYGQGAGASLTIRGLGSGGDTSTDAAVTVDIDGIPTDRGRGIPVAAFDLANVAVLKGPQTLYFGINNPSGVVELTSNDPGETFSGYGKVGYEVNSEEFYGEGAVGGPINDQLRLRIAFQANDMLHGWVFDNARPQPDPFHPGWVLPGAGQRWAPEWKKFGLRVSAIWEPNPQFDAHFKFLGMYYHDDGSAALAEIASCAPGRQEAFDFFVGDPNSGCTLNGVNDHGINPLPRIEHWPHATAQPYSETHAIVSGLTLNFHLKYLTITSVTGIYWYTESNFDMSDPTVLAQYGGWDSESYTAPSEELRLETSLPGRFNFRGGAFFQSERFPFATSDAIFDLIPLGIKPDPKTGQVNNWEDSDLTTGYVYSGFGEVDWKILPNLELDGGARYTYQVKNGNDGTQYVNPSFAAVFPIIPVGTRVIGSVKASNISPQVTLTWHPSENLTVYGAYKTGFKSGGFAMPTVIPKGSTAAEFEYRPETSEGEEIGVKASLLSDRLTGDVTLYNYNYNDLQVTTFNAPTISFLFENAAKARVRGVEAQGDAIVTDNLTFRFDAAYNQALYLSYPGAPCFTFQTAAQGCNLATHSQTIINGPLANAPLWSGSVGFTYHHPIWGGWEAAFNTDVRYNSGYLLGNGPLFKQGPFTIVDLSLHVTSPKDLWEAALIVRDVGNVFPTGFSGLTTPLGPAGQSSGIIPRPQQIYFEVTRKF